jgi:5-methylcytosine-specific restriction endonuclease McrA
MPQASLSSEIRLLVRQRSLTACEYCLIPEASSFFPHEVDHIIARQHGGETLEWNLAFACIVCNKHKGTNLTSIDPQTGAVVPLYHPRRDRWNDHFRLEAEQCGRLQSRWEIESNGIAGTKGG